jgi:hypothetical protein
VHVKETREKRNPTPWAVSKSCTDAASDMSSTGKPSAFNPAPPPHPAAVQRRMWCVAEGAWMDDGEFHLRQSPSWGWLRQGRSLLHIIVPEIPRGSFTPEAYEGTARARRHCIRDTQFRAPDDIIRL